MAFDYAPLAAMADRLLADKGTLSTVRSKTGGTYNPVTGVVTGQTDVNTSVFAVLRSINERNAPGAIIRVGDKLALLDGAIQVGDELIHDGEAWMCVETFHVKPGDTSMLYKAQMRGGSSFVDDSTFG